VLYGSRVVSKLTNFFIEQLVFLFQGMIFLDKFLMFSMQLAEM
jgi:hypothetical protein